MFVERWSPRAMSGDPLEPETLRTLFEAARWAPSSFNEQPWRIIYATRSSPRWNDFLELLSEKNRSWCSRAGLLLVFVSKRTFSRNDKPNRVHTFDCGSAWMCLALQASVLGLVAHGMAGFDADRAGALVGAGDDFDVEAMAAVGHPGDPEDLPESLREAEHPSQRKPLEEFAFEERLRS